MKVPPKLPAPPGSPPLPNKANKTNEFNVFLQIYNRHHSLAPDANRPPATRPGDGFLSRPIRRRGHSLYKPTIPPTPADYSAGWVSVEVSTLSSGSLEEGSSTDSLSSASSCT